MVNSQLHYMKGCTIAIVVNHQFLTAEIWVQLQGGLCAVGGLSGSRTVLSHEYCGFSLPGFILWILHIHIHSSTIVSMLSIY
jgi:hypothetical protein